MQPGSGWLPRLANAVGAFDRTQPPAEGSTAYRQMMERFESHSLSAMGFVWLSTPFARDAAAGDRDVGLIELRFGRRLALDRIGERIGRFGFNLGLVLRRILCVEHRRQGQRRGEKQQPCQARAGRHR